MKKSILFFALAIVTLASCVKDRNTKGGANLGSRKLIHYWSFNHVPTDTALMRYADTTIGGGIFDYIADHIDTLDDGSTDNLRRGEAKGWSVRLRNPYTSMTIHMPTTGYKQPIFTFCVLCSGSSGPTGNDITYTTDGTTYTNASISPASVSIPLVWTVYSIDFSGVPAVDNNPKFAIRLSTTDNNTGTKGNNRYDNISLDAFSN